MTPTSRFFGLLVVAFPFIALFGVPIDISVFWIRPAECLCVFFAPIALSDYFANSSSARKRLTFVMLGGLIVLQVVYATAFPTILHGFGMAGMSYVRLHMYPTYICVLALVIKYWLRRTSIRNSEVLQWVAVAICTAGIVGLYAMRNDALLSFLMETYSGFLVDVDSRSTAGVRFDMTHRAMSVFRGYDQAAVQYASGIIICMILVGVNHLTGRGKKWGFINAVMIIVLMLSIVASARTGAIVVFASCVVVFINRGLFSHKTRILVGFWILAAIGTVFILKNVLLSDTTNERFDDVFGLFSGGADTGILDRSEGLRRVYDTQYNGVAYPQGTRIFFGLGDNGDFVSDSGWVNHYCRFGLVGTLVMGVVLVGFVVYSIRVGNLLKRSSAPSECGMASLALPAFSVLFALAALKGPFYFLTSVSAELFALILAVALVEGDVCGGRGASTRHQRLAGDTQKCRLFWPHGL